MSLLGTCEDCGVHGVRLYHKPDVAAHEQAQPTVCEDCQRQRDRMMREQRERENQLRADMPQVAPSWVHAREGGQ